MADWLAELEDRTAGEVVHKTLTTSPATTSVGALRAYFAESPSRRLAVLADDDGRYVGAVTPDLLPPEGEDDAPAAGFAAREPWVPASASAREATELALLGDSNRLPVVGDDGRLVGVLAVTKTRDGLCGLE